MPPPVSDAFYYPLDTSKPKTWPNHTLVMPVCAVGNVGQLAMDLLISSMIDNKECQLVGRIFSPAIMAVAGPNAFFLAPVPSTSTEAYECPKRKLVLIQQRSSYYKEDKDAYLASLIDWIKASQFSRVIILTSSFDNCIPPEDDGTIETVDRLRSYTTASFQQDEAWKEAAFKQLPASASFKASQHGMTFLPGSGLTKLLMKALEKAHVPAAIIISFCSEGENIQESHALANRLRPVLSLQAYSKWLEPFSWESLLKQDAPLDLFG